MPEPPAAKGFTPEIAKRLIADRLVQYRKACDMSAQQVLLELGWSSNALSGLEQAKVVRVDEGNVRDLLDLYGVPEDESAEMLNLAKSARQRGWYRSKKYRGIFSSAFPGFEAGASEVRTYEFLFIPGLFQTPGYVRWSLQEDGIRDDDEITRRQVARQERQKILTREDEPDEPAEVYAVFDETAILRITDPEVRAEQVTHLIEQNTRPNVRIQVLRLTDGLYPGGEVFTLLGFADPRLRSIVCLESRIDFRLLEREEEVESFAEGFIQLSAVALPPDKTSAYLQTLI
jgi:transcriptional regulator with XRE-family HTH domain